jgi:hypothetical protein
MPKLLTSEEATGAAERVQYDLDQLGKKSGQKLQKLEMQIREHAVDCARLEVLRDKESRDKSMVQRERDKELRQLCVY